MILESAAVGPFFKNGYVLGCERTRQAVFIDPGDEVEQLLDFIKAQELEVTHILLTHAHVDHVSGVAEAKRALGVPIYLHKDDLFLYENAVRTGMMFGLTVEQPPPVDRYYEGDGPIDVRRLRGARAAHAGSLSRRCVPRRLEAGATRPRHACSWATRCLRDRSAAPICRAAITKRCCGRSPKCSSPSRTSRSCIQDMAPKPRSAASAPPIPSSWNTSRMRHEARGT